MSFSWGVAFTEHGLHHEVRNMMIKSQEQGYGDLVILRTPASYAKYELLLELKYLKKDDTTAARINQEFENATMQITEYMKDKRLAMLLNLKKFVIIFRCFEVVKLEEIHID